MSGATTQKEIRCRRFANENPPVNERYRLNAPQEFAVPKFLPTTLRPTHLAYRELYDYQSCALFLADFLNYEQLQPPHRYPLVIPSPSSVLKWRAGDCFDF